MIAPLPSTAPPRNGAPTGSRPASGFEDTLRGLDPERRTPGPDTARDPAALRSPHGVVQHHRRGDLVRHDTPATVARPPGSDATTGAPTAQAADDGAAQDAVSEPDAPQEPSAPRGPERAGRAGDGAVPAAAPDASADSGTTASPGGAMAPAAADTGSAAATGDGGSAAAAGRTIAEAGAQSTAVPDGAGRPVDATPLSADSASGAPADGDESVASGSSMTAPADGVELPTGRADAPPVIQERPAGGVQPGPGTTTSTPGPQPAKAAVELGELGLDAAAAPVVGTDGQGTDASSAAADVWGATPDPSGIGATAAADDVASWTRPDPAGAPWSPTARPAAGPAAGGTVDRIAAIAEQLRYAPPPRTMTVDLEAVGGMRVVVSLRGDAVVVTPVDSQVLDGGFHRDLSRGLAQRGLQYDADGSTGQQTDDGGRRWSRFREPFARSDAGGDGAASPHAARSSDPRGLRL